MQSTTNKNNNIYTHTHTKELGKHPYAIPVEKHMGAKVPWVKLLTLGKI